MSPEAGSVLASRAPRGRNNAELRIDIPESLKKVIVAAAHGEGMTIAAWVERALSERLFGGGAS